MSRYDDAAVSRLVEAAKAYRETVRPYEGVNDLARQAWWKFSQVIDAIPAPASAAPAKGVRCQHTDYTYSPAILAYRCNQCGWIMPENSQEWRPVHDPTPPVAAPSPATPPETRSPTLTEASVTYAPTTTPAAMETAEAVAERLSAAGGGKRKWKTDDPELVAFLDAVDRVRFLTHLKPGYRAAILAFAESDLLAALTAKSGEVGNG